jgi:hypothetical protein
MDEPGVDVRDCCNVGPYYPGFYCAVKLVRYMLYAAGGTRFVHLSASAKPQNPPMHVQGWQCSLHYQQYS